MDFKGKKELEIKFDDLQFIQEIKKEHLEKFAELIIEEMKGYIGEEIINILTPEFTTTTNDSLIVCKLSIMGTFKKYFNYKMRCAGYGIPYIILEGTSDDYKKIKSKVEKLKKYEFKWYIDRIIPHIEKMIKAKEGSIDNNYFKNIIQLNETTEMIPHSGRPKERRVDEISGWFLNFFAYIKDKDDNVIEFKGKYITVSKFDKLLNQRLTVPFKVSEKGRKKNYNMCFKVGFIGCDQNNQKEVFPIEGWSVSRQDEDSDE